MIHEADFDAALKRCYTDAALAGLDHDLIVVSLRAAAYDIEHGSLLPKSQPETQS